tara:strand:- start:1152 stop:1397 length:246 start_codon:yes stop_codon:yes gene_type:complete
MGDIEVLCYDYALVGYILRFTEELEKDNPEFKKLLSFLTSIKIKEKISERMSSFFNVECGKCKTELTFEAKFCSNCGDKKE